MTDQVAFGRSGHRVVGFPVLEAFFNIEIGVQFPVDAGQQVEVKGGGDARRIVVGGQDDFRIFLQVKTDQQQVARVHVVVDLLQEFFLPLRAQVAYGGAQVEDQFPHMVADRQFFQYLKIIPLQAFYIHLGKVLSEIRFQFIQDVLGDIHRQVLKGSFFLHQVPQQDFGFIAVAGAQFHNIEGFSMEGVEDGLFRAFQNLKFTPG